MEALSLTDSLLQGEYEDILKKANVKTILQVSLPLSDDKSFASSILGNIETYMSQSDNTELRCVDWLLT